MTNTEERLKTLFKCARKEPKGDYRVYNAYSRQLNELNLNSKEHTEAIRKLCNILKV